MKCVILAAGYATRLYPLTENFPKPLLKVGGKPILDWLIDDIETTGKVDEYIVVSNHKFCHHFVEWTASRGEKITVIDDGTTSNETRLGAVRDMDFAVKSCSLNDDLLVIAGDNLLDFSLARFIEYALEKKTSCLMRYYEPDSIRLTKSGVVEVDGDGMILSMEEKPSSPRANWCTPPFYYLRKEDVGYIETFLEGESSYDAPGHFFAGLSASVRMYAMEMPGCRYDIGNLESYRKISELFEKR